MNVMQESIVEPRVIALGDAHRRDLAAFFERFIVENGGNDLRVDHALFKNPSRILTLAARSLLELFFSCRDATRESPYVLIEGFPMYPDEHYGPTPPDWRSAASAHRTIREESFVALAATCLGDTFSWPTLQNGRLIHNVLPIEGEEAEQSGHGSAVELAWHTEDAFHPCRGDYLILFGIRNHERVATTLLSIQDIDLDLRSTRLLFEPRYRIRPDHEHLRQLDADGHPARLAMLELQRQPALVAVLFGDPVRPYLRIDPYFMECVDPDGPHARALTDLVAALDALKRDVVVASGSMLIIDNYLAVHGRAPFKARFDGSDRWLKKAVVSRDLRRAKALGFRVSDDLNVY